MLPNTRPTETNHPETVQALLFSSSPGYWLLLPIEASSDRSPRQMLLPEELIAREGSELDGLQLTKGRQH